MTSNLFSWRKWPFWLGAALLFLAVLAISLWLFRASLARQAVQNWCAGQDLTCELKVDGLGLSGARVSELRIRNADGDTPFEAAKAVINIEWPGLFRPAVKSITVDEPVLRGTYLEDNTLTFGGLETLGSGGQSSTTLPEVEVNDARIELNTPAGPLVVHGQARGQLPMQFELNVEIEPVELETEGNRLVVEEGRVDLSIIGIKIIGTAELNLSEAAFEGLSVQNVRLSANMADSLRPTLDWTATIETLGTQKLSARQARVEGTVAIKPARPDGEKTPWLSRVHSATIQAQAQSVGWMQTAADKFDFTLEARRGKSDTLDASYGLVVTGFRRPEVESAELKASGHVNFDDTFDNVSASGDFSFKDTSLPAPYRRDLLELLHVGAPFDDHSRALSDGLFKAMASMSGGTGLSLTRRDGGYWSIVTTRAATVNSANGASFSINPQNGRPVANISDEATELSGLVTLNGPGLPKLVVDLTSAEIAKDALRVETGGLTISPWTVDGLTLGAALNELSLERTGDGPRLMAVGELSVSGTLFGLTLDRTRLFGGIDAAGGSSLRVQTYTTRCLGLDTAGIRSGGGYAIDAISLQLCPRDGRVVRPVTGGSGGTVDLGALRLPFMGETTSGELALSKAVLDWTATKTARLTLTGDQMNLPLTIGEKTLTISSTSPQIRFQSTDPGRLDARLGASEFGGSLVPADIAVESIEVDWTLPGSGIEGTGFAKGVEVRDRGDDPLYVPLRGDLDARFSEGVMSLTGPITTRPAGRTVANLTLDLDLAPLNGTAAIVTPDLVFAPRGFQPTALSERVRGFLSNARGTLRASADFDIKGGKPSGTGWVSVQDFGFDTLRLGAVNDVNGRIDFNDIMTLSTPPGQEIRIGAINPGIPLQNGRLQFQLTNGIEAELEEMRWPFAGGELVSGGSSWTIAGTRDVIEVTAQSLELADLVAIFKIPDLKAEGTVTGTFPVEFVGANTFIRNASLTADNSGGTIAYTGEAGDQAAKADERVSMAFEALKDFDFTVLELNANGNLAGDILITMRLVGKSPKVLDGAPFAFNIGIDSKLMQLIQSGRSVTTSDWLTRVVSDPARQKGSDDSSAPTTPEQ